MNAQPCDIDCLLVNFNYHGCMHTHVQSLEIEFIMKELDGLLENVWIKHGSSISVQLKARFIREVRQFVVRNELFVRLRSRLRACKSTKFLDVKHYARWFQCASFPRWSPPPCTASCSPSTYWRTRKRK